MGMIYRKCYTRPLPPGAQITERDGKRIARWRLRNGTARSGEVVDGRDGKTRVRGRSPCFSVRYRDACGRVIDVSTKCKDKVAARAFLSRLERSAELVRSGLLTPAEADAAGHSDLPFKSHVDAYEKHLRAKGCETRRISMVRRRLERLARECRFGRLNTLSAERVERWLVQQQEANLSASTRNTYRESLVGFGNWCRRTGRLTHNPFADLPRADQNADRRHQRRALTEPELIRRLNDERMASPSADRPYVAAHRASREAGSDSSGL